MNKVKPWRADLNNFNISKMWKYKWYIYFYLYHKKSNRVMLCSIDEDTDVFSSAEFYIKVQNTTTKEILTYKSDEDFTSFNIKEKFHKQICKEIKTQDIRSKYKAKHHHPDYTYPNKRYEYSGDIRNIGTREEYLDCFGIW